MRRDFQADAQSQQIRIYSNASIWYNHVKMALEFQLPEGEFLMCDTRFNLVA